MSRTTFNLWLDLLSFLVMLSLAATGGIIHYVLLPGTGYSHVLFGLGRHDYGEYHFYLAVVALILLVLHLVMHWSWICCVIAKSLGKDQPSRRSQNLWGLITLGGCSLLLCVGLWGASSLVEPRSSSSSLDQEHRPGRGAGDRHREIDQHRGNGTLRRGAEICPLGASINGQSTLQEVIEVTGLTVEALLSALDVSGPVDPQEQIGRLKRQLGFSIHDLRRIICRSK